MADTDAAALSGEVAKLFEKLTPAQRKGVALLCDVVTPALGLVPDPRAQAVAFTLSILCRAVKRR